LRVAEDENTIDTGAIAAAGRDVRSIAKEIVVGAGADEVWAAWTSSDGIAAWWNPPITRIDLRIGGPFELLFSVDEPEGLRGSEGCKYLAYVPGEMVAFTWNAPPHLALRATHTWVVITFTRLGDTATGVRLVHTGFLEGPDWTAYSDYFDDAWDRVLRRLAEHWSD
jgi:uncharacterized protein YndB with AHSA1/START domain